MNRFILSLTLLVSSTLFAATAFAQGYAVYGAVQPEYRVSSFRLYPPTGDGWRQITSDTTALRLVYAEMLDAGTINTRAEVVAEAFPIPSPDLVPNGLRLTLNSQSQQMEKYGEQLLGYTRVEKLEAGVEAHGYTLKSRVTDKVTRYETFIVAVSPDRAEYLVVKFTIDEDDYNKQPFFQEFLESMKKMTYPLAAGSPAEAESADEVEAGEGESDADVVPDSQDTDDAADDAEPASP